ncbi:MAG: transglycosylase domain-containing protein [Bacteroidales bacterium]|nr:transglycosylase domain-containing protein [Bacteroidales bacterium]
MAEKAEKKSYRSYVWGFWSIYLVGLAAVVMLFVGIASGWLGFMPTFEQLENPKSYLASEVISSDQQTLGKYYIENRSNVHYSELSPNLVNALVATEDIRFRQHSGVDGKALIRVAYGLMTGTHKGGGSTITQQLAKNLFPRDDNLSSVELVIRKLKEWVTAIKLERNYSKNEIVAMYLNTVPFGSHTFGIKSAAKTFYNKRPIELNKEEAAMLVGVLKAQSWYNPVRNPQRAYRRRNVVLGQLEKYDYITKPQFDSLTNLPVDMSDYRVQDHIAGPAPYFREFLRNILYADKPKRDDYYTFQAYKEDSIEWQINPVYGWVNKNPRPDGTKYNLYKDGLKIYTTINARMQKHAEAAVQEHLSQDLQPTFFEHWEDVENAPFNFEEDAERQIEQLMTQAMRRTERYRRLNERGMSMDSIKKVFNTPTKMEIFSWGGDIDTIMTPMDSIRYHKSILQSGLLSMEPQTGYVRAYVGGIDYEYFKYDHVTQGKRQVGSTFKPFLYTLAMQHGNYSPCSKVPNVQPSVELPSGEIWEPKNSTDYKEGQMVTLKEALANSINWVSAYLIKRYTPSAVKKVVHKMGVKSHIPAVPAISLGTPDLSLYEMVGAMNTYANKGVYIKPSFVTRIEDKHGNVIEEFIPYQEEAMSAETAYLMLELMKGVVQTGTGVRLRWKYEFQNPIAGKTGTTQNNSDGWFMGITPDLTTGIWTGAEDRSVHFRTIKLGQGANMALPIWALYMKRIYADSSLKISRGDFEKPPQGISVEIDCEKYEQQQETNPLRDDRGGF